MYSTQAKNVLQCRMLSGVENIHLGHHRSLRIVAI